MRIGHLSPHQHVSSALSVCSGGSRGADEGCIRHWHTAIFFAREKYCQSLTMLGRLLQSEAIVLTHVWRPTVYTDPPAGFKGGHFVAEKDRERRTKERRWIGHCLSVCGEFSGSDTVPPL